MTDSTNNSFEEQWQNAFDDAELTPPESVWEKIELGLKPENMLPSKTNFGNKPYYFLGGIIVGLLGTFLWFKNAKKESQVSEKENISIEKNIIKSEPVYLEKTGEVITKKTNQRSNYKAKIVRVFANDANYEVNRAEESLYVETQITPTQEIPIRTLIDSVEMIEPLSTKIIHSEIENPTIYLPTNQTPYYVKPILKSQKKSILKNVKFSIGAGIHQQ